MQVLLYYAHTYAYALCVFVTYIKIGDFITKMGDSKENIEKRYSFLFAYGWWEDDFMNFKFWLRFGRNSKLQYVSLLKQKSSQFYRNIYKH